MFLNQPILVAEAKNLDLKKEILFFDSLPFYFFGCGTQATINHENSNRPNSSGDIFTFDQGLHEIKWGIFEHCDAVSLDLCVERQWKQCT